MSYAHGCFFCFMTRLQFTEQSAATAAAGRLLFLFLPPLHEQTNAEQQFDKNE